jgi:hypothetical protein
MAALDHTDMKRHDGISQFAACYPLGRNSFQLNK